MKHYTGLRILRSLMLSLEQKSTKKKIVHRVSEFDNPSKYVPRATGLIFLEKARRSAILNPRWFIIAVAL